MAPPAPMQPGPPPPTPPRPSTVGFSGQDAGRGPEPSGTGTSFPRGRGRLTGQRPWAVPSPGLLHPEMRHRHVPEEPAGLPGTCVSARCCDRARGGHSAKTRNRVSPAARTPASADLLRGDWAGEASLCALGGRVLSPGGRLRQERPGVQACTSRRQGSCCKCRPPGDRGAQSHGARGTQAQVLPRPPPPGVRAGVSVSLLKGLTGMRAAGCGGPSGSPRR